MDSQKLPSLQQPPQPLNSSISAVPISSLKRRIIRRSSSSSSSKMGIKKDYHSRKVVKKYLRRCRHSQKVVKKDRPSIWIPAKLAAQIFVLKKKLGHRRLGQTIDWLVKQAVQKE